MDRRACKGTTITLAVEFTDADGNLVDPDTSPSVSIFDEEHDPSAPGTVDADALVLNATDSSYGEVGQTGNYYVTYVETGRYTYQYDIDALADAGTWFDRWSASINGNTVTAVLEFTVVAGNGLVIEGRQLFDNNLVVLTIYTDAITDEDGNALEEDYQAYFTTTYSPLYSSARRMQLRMGEMLRGIPEDTINLAIYKHSLDLDAFMTNVTIAAGCSNYYYFIRNRYVECAATLELVNPKSALIADLVNSRKHLGDLDISAGNTGRNIGIKGLEECVNTCRRVLMSGCTISQDTGIRATTVVRGEYLESRPVFGREWEPTRIPGGSDVGAANDWVGWGERKRKTYKR